MYYAVLCHRLTDHVFNLSICVVLCSVLSVSQSVLRKLCARVCVLFCFVPKTFFFYKVGCCRKRNIEIRPNCSGCQSDPGILTNNSA